MSMPPRPQVLGFASLEAASRHLAEEICNLIRERREAGRGTVLGLATGATPLPLYVELIRRHRDEGFSFADVTTFNLDEYLGLPANHPASFRTFMRHNLFEHLDIPPEQVHLPDGTLSDDALTEHCLAYEEAIREAGGIDLQILGIGRTGHIGFNEPGSPRDSRTRVVHLDERTRRDNAPAFAHPRDVPTRAVTMGCATILEARRIRLLASGSAKAEIVRQAVTGPVTDAISASFLQLHPDAVFLLDREAADTMEVSEVAS